MKVKHARVFHHNNSLSSFDVKSGMVIKHNPRILKKIFHRIQLNELSIRKLLVQLIGFIMHGFKLILDLYANFSSLLPGEARLNDFKKMLLQKVLVAFRCLSYGKTGKGQPVCLARISLFFNIWLNYSKIYGLSNL